MGSGLEWDLLVIDEAHEGVDTHRTDIAFKQIDGNSLCTYLGHLLKR